MKSWQELPAEILDCIFEHVTGTSSLFTCQRVCKSWFEHVQGKSYNKVNIKTLEQFIAFANAMASKPSQGPGQYVKVFSTLTEDFSTVNNFVPDKATLEKYLLVILKSCPNLKSIDVENFEGHHVVYKAISEELKMMGALLWKVLLILITLSC